MQGCRPIDFLERSSCIHDRQVTDSFTSCITNSRATRCQTNGSVLQCNENFPYHRGLSVQTRRSVSFLRESRRICRVNEHFNVYRQLPNNCSPAIPLFFSQFSPSKLPPTARRTVSGFVLVEERLSSQRDIDIVQPP